MKKTFITLLALAGVAMGETITGGIDFTTLTGNSNDNMPDGWTTGQWQGDNKPHYAFSAEKGAYVNNKWKQNNIWSSIELSSQAEATITFTVWNGSQDTGNMFFLSSDSYSIIIGNSYNSNPNVYVGTEGEEIHVSVFDDSTYYCSFANGRIDNVLDNSSNFSVAGNLTYTLTLSEGNMAISVSNSDGASYSYTLENMTDVTFDKIGFMTDAAAGNASVKNVSWSITTPDAPSGNIPEPATATLSLLALAGLCARRRRA